MNQPNDLQNYTMRALDKFGPYPGPKGKPRV